MSIHRVLVERLISTCKGERAGYLQAVLDKLEDDPRTEAKANLVYLTLKEAGSLLPLILPVDLLVERLFSFIDDEEWALRAKLYDPTYVTNPATIREVTDKFVGQIVDTGLVMAQTGRIPIDEQKPVKFTWPYRAEDMLDPDASEAEIEDALAEAGRRRAAYTGPERRNRDKKDH